MRIFRGILLAASVTLALGGGQIAAKPAAKAKDPLVGQWVMNQGGPQGGAPMVLNFRPDGTVQFDRKSIEAQIRASAGTDPATRQRVEQALKQVRATKLTWKKSGKLYLLGSPAGATAGQQQYVKIQGKRLISVTKDGKPVQGGPSATRK